MGKHSLNQNFLWVKIQQKRKIITVNVQKKHLEHKM